MDLVRKKLIEELEILEEFGNKYNIKEIKREEDVYVYQEEINSTKDIAPAVMYTLVGTIRSYYTMPAYINEIEKHAEMYNLGIGESES